MMVKDTNLPQNAWEPAHVATVYPSADGQVRKVQVALADACLDKKGRRSRPMWYLERPVQKLILLVPSRIETGVALAEEPAANHEL